MEEKKARLKEKNQFLAEQMRVIREEKQKKEEFKFG